MPRGIKASVICPDCDGHGTPRCTSCEGTGYGREEGTNEHFTVCTDCSGAGYYDFRCIRCSGTGNIKPPRKPRTPKTTKQVKNDKPVVMPLSDDDLCFALEVAYDNLMKAFNNVTDRLSHRIDKDHIAYLHQAYDLSETRLFKVYARMHKIIIGH